MRKILLFLVVLLAVVAAGALGYGWALVGQPYRGYSGETVVDIPAGIGSEEIVDLLLTRVFSSTVTFRWLTCTSAPIVESYRQGSICLISRRTSRVSSENWLAERSDSTRSPCRKA